MKVGEVNAMDPRNPQDIDFGYITYVKLLWNDAMLRVS